MEGTLEGRTCKGMKTAIAWSAAIHILAAAIVLYMHREEPKRIFVNPYTVDLVAPKAAPPDPVRKADPEKTKPAEERQEPLRKTAPVKEAVKAPQRETLDVGEAVKKIREGLKKKEAEALVASSIDRLKKKQEEENKRLSGDIDDIRRRLRSKAQTPRPEHSAQPQAAVPGTMESKYPAYYALIKERVQSEWTDIERVRSDKVSVIVSIRISRSGELVDTWLEKSSGNPRFDQSLLNAVKKASPFPPLPEEFPGSYLETGLRFCPGCKR